ncbi:MAG: hypothetical protein RLZZ74_3726 [Cyanobacteriota bacterium]
MVACPIPEQGHTAIGMLLEERINKGYRALSIAFVIGLEQAFLSVKIDCPIVGLSLSFIDDGHFDALRCFAPDVTAQVAPQ